MLNRADNIKKTITLLICATLIPASFGICWPCAPRLNTPAAHHCCTESGERQTSNAPAQPDQNKCANTRPDGVVAVLPHLELGLRTAPDFVALPVDGPQTSFDTIQSSIAFEISLDVEPCHRPPTSVLRI